MPAPCHVVVVCEPPSLHHQLTDYFCPNETEAALITNLPTTTDAEFEAAGKAILKRGPRNVVMTLGGQGALLLAADGSVTHFPATLGDAVDTSGAGDSFVGSFSAFIAQGVDTDEAIKRAVYVPHPKRRLLHLVGLQMTVVHVHVLHCSWNPHRYVSGQSVTGKGTQMSYKGAADLHF